LKSPTNESTIFNILTSKFDKLTSKGDDCSFADNLAYVQALIIYQFIRLFDGDIRQRGIAESQNRLLEECTAQLQQRQEWEIPMSIQSSPWRKWLFSESVRRTILTSVLLKAIYSSLKDGYCDSVPALARLPVTSQEGLWDLKTEGEWMQSTQGFQPMVLSYHEYVESWESGLAGGDAESFQKMLLVPCLGEEKIQTRFLESLTIGVGWR